LFAKLAAFVDLFQKLRTYYLRIEGSGYYSILGSIYEVCAYEASTGIVLISPDKSDRYVTNLPHLNITVAQILRQGICTLPLPHLEGAQL
jgi:hypothetical protein